MIDFRVSGDLLLLVYVAGTYTDPGWVRRDFRHGKTVTLRKCFTLTNNDLLEPFVLPTEEKDVDTEDEEETDDPVKYEFVFGEREGEYFRISSKIIGTRNSFFIHEGLDISKKTFVAYRDISILRKIDSMCSEPVFIGGNQEGCIPEESYYHLLRIFPTSTELNHYASARVAACVREHLDTVRDLEKIYNSYLNKKVLAKGSNILPVLAETELAKYRTVRDKLKDMLASEVEYSERQWQQEIVSIIRLLHPKYIRVFEKVKIRDTVNTTHRELDMMLVDACGHIDLIEIKKPFDKCILSQTEYRDNFIPARELAGSVMQMEKYIYYLNKWGSEGEKVLSERFAKDLPTGLTLKIVNPSGLIVMGREVGMTKRQRSDYEIVKRKFRNVADIITYDDLVARLELLVNYFSSQSTNF